MLKLSNDWSSVPRPNHRPAFGKNEKKTPTGKNTINSTRKTKEENSPLKDVCPDKKNDGCTEVEKL